MNTHRNAEPGRVPKGQPPTSQPEAPHAASTPPAFSRVVGNRAVVARLTDTRESLERDADQVSGTTGSGAAPVGIPPSVTGSGRPLDAGTRHRLELTFGEDLSGVRVHDDARAAADAGEIGARAFTAGQHIVFGAGQHAPGSPRGDRLLAHEVRHTLQHAAGLGDGAVQLAPEDVPALDQRLADGVRTHDYRQAAEALNAFSVEDIRARLSPDPAPGKVVLPRGEIAAIHLAALDDPRLGGESNVARLTRPAYLDVNIANSVAQGDWAAAATYLNAFNPADLGTRLAAFGLDQLEALTAAAVSSPQLGAGSDIAVLGDRARAAAQRRKLEAQVASLQKSDELNPPVSSAGGGRPGSLTAIAVGGSGSETGVAMPDREMLAPSTDWRGDPRYIDNQVASASYNILSNLFQIFYDGGGSLILDYDHVISKQARAGTSAGALGGPCFRHRGNGRIYPVLLNRATVPMIMALADDIERQEPTARANTEEALMSIASSVHAVAGAAVKGGAAAAAAGGGGGRAKLFSMGGRRADKSRWYLRDVDPAQVRKSTQGHQVYEYYTAEGECIYIGKSGGLDGETPGTWVDRGWDHLYKKPAIAEASRVKVTAELTHAEAAALEADRLAEHKTTFGSMPRLNQREGDPPPGQNLAANVQSASRAPRYTFESEMQPGPGSIPDRRPNPFPRRR